MALALTNLIALLMIAREEGIKVVVDFISE
jgi:hypothetical protein